MGIRSRSSSPPPPPLSTVPHLSVSNTNLCLEATLLPALSALFSWVQKQDTVYCSFLGWRTLHDYRKKMGLPALHRAEPPKLIVFLCVKSSNRGRKCSPEELVRALQTGFALTVETKHSWSYWRKVKLTLLGSDG